MDSERLQIPPGRANGQDGSEVLSSRAAIEAVRAAVASWEGVTIHDHRFGGIEFRVGRRELGHLHRAIADLPFPRAVRDELVAEGRARPHHVLPESGWVTVPMRTASEVANVIALFQQNYKRAVSAQRGAVSEPVQEPNL
jgi:Luciferase